MGCTQQCRHNRSSEWNELIQQSFILNNLEYFKYNIERLIKDYPSIDINKFKINSLFSYDLTLPSLCIIYGRLSFFQYLESKAKINILSIEENLVPLRVCSLYFLFSKNYPDFLVYYFPLYLKNLDLVPRPSSYSISFEEPENQETTDSSPIQMACECGNLSVIDVMYNNFRYAVSIIPELNVNSVNKSTGENCALIACRMLNYTMIRFLHLKCQGDFSVTDLRGKNALQIACISHKKNSSVNLLMIIKYLVEEIKADVRYNYEETLMLCEEPSTFYYLENQISLLGLVLNSSILSSKSFLST